VRALLDTNVLSELGKPDGSTAVHDFVALMSTPETYLSVITIGEIALGIEVLPSGRKRTAFANWLLRVESTFQDRILPCDLEVARIWGVTSGHAKALGINIPTSDGLIAATALRHGLTVITRNRRHFDPLGVVTVNPWEY